MAYICTDYYLDNINNIKLENFAELDLYRCKYKQAFFLISSNNNNVKKIENNSKNRNNKIIEDNDIKDKENEHKTNILTQNSNQAKFWSSIADKNSLNNLKGMLPKNNDKYTINYDYTYNNVYKTNNIDSDKKTIIYKKN